MSLQTILPAYLQKYEQTKKATISVDWFQIYGKININIDDDVLFYAKENYECLYYGNNKELVIKHKGVGAGVYLHNFDVYLYGEHVANLCAFPGLSALDMNMPKNAISLKIENHLLYTDNWLVIFDYICEKLQISISNVTRLDIAIDNTKNVKEFMNFYITDKDVKRAGKSPKEHEKGGVSAVRFDEENGFCSFRVGSVNSDKYISIYNKTSEIQSHSNKKYITEFWQSSGIDTNEQEQVYRTEIRMNSKAIANIKNFEIDMLDNKEYLASIFKTQTNGFFEFYYNSDSNSSRCPRIELIDYDNLGATFLNKTKKEPPKDVYKAKLTLHLLHKLIFQNRINVADYEAEIANLSQKIKYDFDLEDWLTISKEKWQKKYKVNLYQLVEIYAKKECIRLNLSLQSLYNQKHTPEIDFEVCKSYGFDGSFDLFLQYWQKITLN